MAYTIKSWRRNWCLILSLILAFISLFQFDVALRLSHSSGYTQLQLETLETRTGSRQEVNAVNAMKDQIKDIEQDHEDQREDSYTRLRPVGDDVKQVIPTGSNKKSIQNEKPNVSNTNEDKDDETKSNKAKEVKNNIQEGTPDQSGRTNETNTNEGKDDMMHTKEDSKHVQKDVLDPQQQEYPFTFSACLMIKDNNQILPEWLAYHYTVMPLRHVIIGVDPLSFTKVEPIVEKFRSIGMKIMLVTGNSYFVDGRWSVMKYDNFDPKNHTWEHRLGFFNHRQNWFYTQCLRTFKAQGFNHTMIIDTDEYITYNQNWNKTRDRWMEDDDDMDIDDIPDIPKHVGKQNETMAHWIQSRADPILSKLHLSEKDDKFCIVLPRILFQSIETRFSDNEEKPKYLQDGGFNESYFDTLLYQTRGAIAHEHPQTGKSLINVEGYNGHDKVEGPHNSFPHVGCYILGFKGLVSDTSKYSMHIHHMVGSFEVFTSLSHFRDMGKFESKKVDLMHGNATDDTKVGWIEEFINLVGWEKALEVTQLTRMEAIAHDGALTKRLRQNETLEYVYEWDVPKELLNEEELKKLEFK